MPEPGPNAPTLAVLLYDDMTPLDVTGPMQMLGMLRLQGWRVVTVAKRRATHWLWRDQLERAGIVYTPARVHHAGRVWTSAGVSAGIDLGLALVDQLGGRALAEHAQLVAQYDPKPPLDAGSPEKAPAAAAAVRAMHRRMMADIEARASARAPRDVPARTQ